MLTTKDIAKRYSVKPRTVRDKWSKDPSFPPPRVNISQRVRAWAEEDIEAWATGERQCLRQTPGNTAEAS